MLGLLWVSAPDLAARALAAPSRPRRRAPAASVRARALALAGARLLLRGGRGRARAPGRRPRSTGRRKGISTGTTFEPGRRAGRQLAADRPRRGARRRCRALVVAVLAGRYPRRRHQGDRASSGTPATRSRASSSRSRSSSSPPAPCRRSTRRWRCWCSRSRCTTCRWRSGRSAPRWARFRRGSRRRRAGSDARPPRSFGRSPRPWCEAGSSPAPRSSSCTRSRSFRLR